MFLNWLFQDNVGLPSFSSTPIPEDSGQFQFNNSRNESNILVSRHCIGSYVKTGVLLHISRTKLCVTLPVFSVFDAVSGNDLFNRAQQAVFKHVNNQRRTICEMVKRCCENVDIFVCER